jgi:pimeloyl-ACP methyl ester carboxylesterase
VGRVAELGWRATARLVSIPPADDIPDGELLDLPGRGQTYVIDTGPVETARGNSVQPPPLFLLHALACTGLLTWYPALRELRQHYRVVLFDQRWHGQGIHSPRFTLEDCADDAAAVADALGIGRFVAVGYSMGSLVAQLTWRRHPQRLAGAVLCASTTRFTGSRNDPAALRVVSAGLAAAAAKRRGAVVRGVREQPPRCDHNRRDHNRWAFAQFRSTPGSGVAGAAAAISRFDSSAWIGGMDVPTAVVVTGRDRLISPARQHALARLIPNSAVYEVDAGHASCVLRAERFTPAVRSACASVAARAAAHAPR